MRKNLKLLNELQEIDLKLDGMQNEKDALLGEIAALEGMVEESRSALAAVEAEAASTEEEKNGIEESLGTERDNIVRSEARLKEIKTQKEYQAVSKEISSARKLTVELEEQVLQKVARIEELAADVAARKENLAALEGNASQQKGEVQEKIDKLMSEYELGQTAREAAVKGLPASVVRRYGILREQRRGIAVVEARDGACLGCNMNLPPQLYNMLYRADDLITCPHCQRILLLRQQEQ